MGVSGSGKTTIARALAERLGHDFMDADDLHPPANRARLAAGTALTDADRAPWLDSVARAISSRVAGGGRIVVACSALKRVYRDRLRRAAEHMVFVHLDLDRDTLMQRIHRRRGHFMPQSLLDDQLATLQPPAADERAVIVRPLGPVADTVEQVISNLRRIA
ncbi:gluconokinase [Lysobacter sp. D1-1-M9]|uniref:gluconokinase n=1 Tax=Novilysobacter longmucuonensis TaxID=3098603 RepID=UPI003983580A